MEVDLCFEDHEFDSVFFEFFVTSPMALAKRQGNSFMPPTLVLKEFDWVAIKNHVTKLLMHAYARSKGTILIFLHLLLNSPHATSRPH
jgi:hypothetical protein